MLDYRAVPVRMLWAVRCLGPLADQGALPCKLTGKQTGCHLKLPTFQQKCIGTDMPPPSVSFLMNEHTHTKGWHFTESWLPWSVKCHMETEMHLLGNNMHMKHIKNLELIENKQKKKKKKKLSSEGKETIYFLTIIFPLENLILLLPSPNSCFVSQKHWGAIPSKSKVCVRVFFSWKTGREECKGKSWLTFKLYLQ